MSMAFLMFGSIEEMGYVCCYLCYKIIISVVLNRQKYALFYYIGLGCQKIYNLWYKFVPWKLHINEDFIH